MPKTPIIPRLNLSEDELKELLNFSLYQKEDSKEKDSQGSEESYPSTPNPL